MLKCTFILWSSLILTISWSFSCPNSLKVAISLYQKALKKTMSQQCPTIIAMLYKKHRLLDFQKYDQFKNSGFAIHDTALPCASTTEGKLNVKIINLMHVFVNFYIGYCSLAWPTRPTFFCMKECGSSHTRIKVTDWWLWLSWTYHSGQMEFRRIRSSKALSCCCLNRCKRLKLWALESKDETSNQRHFFLCFKRPWL